MNKRKKALNKRQEAMRDKKVFVRLTPEEHEILIQVMKLSGSRTKAEALRRSIRAYYYQLDSDKGKTLYERTREQAGR